MRRVRFSHVERVTSTFAWSYAFVYVGMWLMAVATVRGQSFLSVDPNCVTIATLVTPLWHCAEGAIMAVLADAANASLLATLWVPSFILAGLVNPYSATIAVPILLIHAIGVPTTVYALVRTMTALVEGVISPICRRLWARLTAMPRRQFP